MPGVFFLCHFVSCQASSISYSNYIKNTIPTQSLPGAWRLRPGLRGSPAGLRCRCGGLLCRGGRRGGGPIRRSWRRARRRRGGRLFRRRCAHRRLRQRCGRAAARRRPARCRCRGPLCGFLR